MDHETIKRVIDGAAKLTPVVAKHYYDESEKPPSKLYHYTSLNTLMTMLNKGFLNADEFCFGSWLAGSCLTQNDSEEYGIAGLAFHNFVDGPNQKKYRIIADQTNKHSQALEPFFINAILRTYAICFSTEPDQLQQWLIYGDGGQGVCLEIDSEAMWQLALQQKWNFTDVLYGEEKIVEKLDSMLSECEDALNGSFIQNGIYVAEPNMPLSIFMAFMSLVGGKSKSRDYECESEWRLFAESWSDAIKSQKKQDSCVWDKSGYVKHGVVVDLKSESSLVTKIILGPLCDPLRNSATISGLLQDFPKCKDIEITKSRVPYAG